ncbi:MAG: poly(R)-hydroxyalkanoic acid synthase subunit PhaE [Deferrisomatales bacterium]|nr:poly(R)-hydroxyalkanoic acid synthase subunit PhaE [Deferrisomatales bacterium]
MNWTEQTQAMVKSWAETQKKLWEGWNEASQSAASSGGENAWGQWGKAWQEMVRQSLGKLSGSPAGGVPREVAERMFGGEEVFLRFVEHSLSMLRAVAPKIDTGGDWAELLRREFAQLKEEMSRSPASWYGPEAAAAAARDIPELWKLYAQQIQKGMMPWVSSLQEARGHVGEAMGGDRQAVVRMYNLFMDTFETTAGKLTAAPAIGYTREFQEKLTRAFETWVEVRRAEVDFRTELVNTGFHALEGLLRELVEKGERGEKIDTFRGLFDLWVATAEKTYFEIASTDSFAEIQGRLVNAAMQYRIRERELADSFAKALHLPTRRELDDAYRHLHDLKTEVRRLRAEVAHVKASAGQPPAPPPPTPPRAKRAKAAPKPVARKETKEA